MEDKELKEVSGGASVYVQGFMMFFCIIFITIIILIIPFRLLDFDGVCFVVLLIAAAVLFAVLPLIYSDIYLSGNTLIMKKIIGTKRKPISDFNAIDLTILPFVCYIEFKDGKKVYFSLTPNEIIKNFMGTDVVKPLRVLLEERSSNS
ncbi:MAG: hypothetical protein JWQ63_2483 [Mucilaginibacter sp.]|jgi:hypothetical protein|nr:hypothetical protein [Mucilaginibacter sp.]